MLLLAMISLQMLTFRLMVTMVANFCSLVILIHNTLEGEITISSKWVEVTTILGEVTVMCGVVECCRGATLSREDGRKAGACAFSK